MADQEGYGPSDFVPIEELASEDLKFVVEELFNYFNSAEFVGEKTMVLHSDIGSKFYWRVQRAAKELGIANV